MKAIEKLGDVSRLFSKLMIYHKHTTSWVNFRSIPMKAKKTEIYLLFTCIKYCNAFLRQTSEEKQ